VNAPSTDRIPDKYDQLLIACSRDYKIALFYAEKFATRQDISHKLHIIMFLKRI
jgi:hypothetical protein